MIRRMIVPGSPLLGAAMIAKSSDESADIKKEKSLICKPSALPIYSSVDRWLSRCSFFILTCLIDVYLHFSEVKVKRDHKPSKVAETIEEGVKTVRHELSKVTDIYDSQKAQLERHYVTAMKDTQRKLIFYQKCFEILIVDCCLFRRHQKLFARRKQHYA